MDANLWYLESLAEASGAIQRTVLRPLPFSVGRRHDSDLVLDSHHGSQRHAEFFARDGGLWLRDLGSTNGTAVNGERLHAERQLNDGDLVHFADRGFRVIGEAAAPAQLQTQTFTHTQALHLTTFARRPLAFQEMLYHGRLRIDYQPLVRLADGVTFGYEVLGRGALDGVETSPGDLFFLAEKLRLETELSAAFRARGVELGTQLPGAPVLFVNTHPRELKSWETLLASVAELRSRHPAARLVLEIHEAAVTNVATLRSLQSGLEALDVGLAFDDFGIGQARILELIEVAPSFLKFDAALISQLHQAPTKRREMVEGLLRVVVGMGITAVAECIETAEEAEACRSIGFELAQGYYFGRPGPAESFR